MLRMTFDEIGLGSVQSRFGMRADRMTKGRKTLIKTEGRRLIRFLKDEAPKNTGVFAAGITGQRTETVIGTSVAEIVSTGEHAWLLPIIVKGSKAHEIPTGGAAAQMAKGYPLSFYWGNGPNGPGVYHYWRVWHPGTKPNPFIKRAVRRWKPWATRRLREVGVSITNLRGTV